MSYRGLGQAAEASLPPFDTLPKEGERFGDMWALVSDPSHIQAMRSRLVALRALSPIESDMSLAEGGALVTGLRNFWIRASRNLDLWPGAHPHQWYNFGPTNNQDGVGQIRINRRMWDLLGSADTVRPFRDVDSGYTRIRASDPLLNAARNKLQELGYIDASIGTSVRDGSAFVDALHKYQQELANIGVDGGSWPSGFNFGPNDGDELRVDPKLLNSLVNTQDNPRRAAAISTFTSALSNLRCKPPIIGSVGSSAASTTLRTISPTLRSALLAGNSAALRTALVGSRASLLIKK